MYCNAEQTPHQYNLLPASPNPDTNLMNGLTICEQFVPGGLNLTENPPDVAESSAFLNDVHKLLCPQLPGDL